MFFVSVIGLCLIGSVIVVVSWICDVIVDVVFRFIYGFNVCI